MVITIVLIGIVSGGLDSVAAAVVRLGPAALFAGGVGAVVGWIVGCATTYAVTRGAVRFKSGVFRVKEKSIPLDRLQSVDESEGPLQRLFGVRALRLQAAGSGKDAEIALNALAPAGRRRAASGAGSGRRRRCPRGRRGSVAVGPASIAAPVDPDLDRTTRPGRADLGPVRVPGARRGSRVPGARRRGRAAVRLADRREPAPGGRALRGRAAARAGRGLGSGLRRHADRVRRLRDLAPRRPAADRAGLDRAAPGQRAGRPGAGRAPGRRAPAPAARDDPATAGDRGLLRRARRRADAVSADAARRGFRVPRAPCCPSCPGRSTPWHRRRGGRCAVTSAGLPCWG